MGAALKKPLGNSMFGNEPTQRAARLSSEHPWGATRLPAESQQRQHPESETERRGYPTVLVVGDQAELCSRLVQLLRQEGYLVLDAPDGTDARKIVIRHSRPIHVLLIEASMENHITATNLQPFRPEMKVLFVGLRQDHPSGDILTPENAVEEVRHFFERPRAAVGHMGG